MFLKEQEALEWITTSLLEYSGAHHTQTNWPIGRRSKAIQYHQKVVQINSLYIFTPRPTDISSAHIISPNVPSTHGCTFTV